MAALKIASFLTLISLGSAWNLPSSCYVRGSTESNTRFEALEKMIQELQASISALEEMPTTAAVPGGSEGGLVYTRWGSLSCPNITGTELLYVGRTAGTRESFQGGGSNYLCMPEDPEFSLPTRSGQQAYSFVDTVEYQAPINGPSGADVACSVCDVTGRIKEIMIPAKTTCPSGWTEEYHGYLMSEHRGNFRTTYICVDASLEFTPNTLGNLGSGAGHLFNAEPFCGQPGLACPPYNNQMELTCVVCTK